MPFIGLLFIFILVWYPCYRYIVFPYLLRCKWFREAFEITMEKEEAFKMGLGAPGLSTGFWLFYFVGFIVIAVPAMFIMVYEVVK